VRAGAKLLFDSISEEEKAETELKASALIAAIAAGTEDKQKNGRNRTCLLGKNIHILLVDHEDSFVHTLANYFCQTGARVTTVRTPVSDSVFAQVNPDFVVLSPGPGLPGDFDCAATIASAHRHDIPVFVVCLGLQAIIETYGGHVAATDPAPYMANLHVSAWWNWARFLPACQQKLPSAAITRYLPTVPVCLTT